MLSKRQSMMKPQKSLRVSITLPKVQKLYLPPANQELITFKPFANSELTCQRSIRIPGKQSPSLYQYLYKKINDPIPLYYLKPFSSRSMTNKHYYNLEKRLDNLQEVLNFLQEINGQEKGEIKEEIREILGYQKHLMERYENYEQKLEKLVELEKECKLLAEKKVSQFLDSSKTSKRSKRTINKEIQVQFIFQSEKISIPSDDQIVSFKHQQETPIQMFSLPVNTSKIDSVNQLESQGESQKARNKIQQKEQEKCLLEQKLELLKSQIEQSKQKQNKLREKIKVIQQKKHEQLEQIASFEKVKFKLNEQSRKLSQSLENQKQVNTKLQNQLSELLFHQSLIINPIQELYLMKKTLNNQLQQMRGTIRVYCRIRPLKSSEVPMVYDLKSHDFLQIKKTLQDQKSENIKTDFKFVFDRIFDQNTSQEEVFSEISQLIQTAIDGVNVCIFAYGQTGSGKTFTMQGNGKKEKKSIGIISRSTELIFTQLQKYRENGWETALEVSINEIYNDEAVNLLAKSECKMTKPIFTPTKSIIQVEQLFTKATLNRSTAFTLSNADSSRSHLIFIIRIKSKSPGNNQQKPQQRESQLVLVDLAGSERVKESGVSNERMKEAQHINYSLSQLGQVIRSLKINKGKTNFRNSKLTHFLEPYLQKGSKCIMFVNISPAMSDESQSINSLKFASTARQCRLQAD